MKILKTYFVMTALVMVPELVPLLKLPQETRLRDPKAKPGAGSNLLRLNIKSEFLAVTCFHPRGSKRMMKRLFLFLLVLVGTLSARADEAFRITILDAENDWPVPLVELRTVHHQRFLSDNAGVIAVDDPELMSREVWFTVRGHGYGVKKDSFGREGVRLTPSPGGEAVVRVQRQLPGKRLGRLTGAGLFAESQRFGEQLDWPESGIVGCDSVLTARHGDRLFWVWGDTLVAKYPLGLYHSSSATTSLRPLKQFEPPIRLPLEYFRDAEGAVRNVAEMPGKGPTWLGGLTSLPDQSGKERLVATYVKIRGHLTVYESGLCVWNEEMARFDRHKVLWNEERGRGKGACFTQWTSRADSRGGQRVSPHRESLSPGEGRSHLRGLGGPVPLGSPRVANRGGLEGREGDQGAQRFHRVERFSPEMGQRLHSPGG